MWRGENRRCESNYLADRLPAYVVMNSRTAQIYSRAEIAVFIRDANMKGVDEENTVGNRLVFASTVILVGSVLVFVVVIGGLFRLVRFVVSPNKDAGDENNHN